jgi:HK97 family phage portal protein
VGLWDSVTRFMAIEPMRERDILFESNALPLEDQILELRRRRLGVTKAWRHASVREALGVPAIFRAVTLIANTTASLGIEAYRKGVRLSDDETPTLIKRPDPFRIPRDFYRDTASDLASWGEFWWWVARRDSDERALSLIVVPPWEITVELGSDRLRPRIMWTTADGTKEMRREDMRHGTFRLDETGLRGVGPLQLCGAAVSVAVEAQDWAANFYADGGTPSYTIKSAVQLTQDEASDLKSQWTNQPNNVPRVIDPGIEDVKQFGVNEQGAGMLASREYNNGDAARMFGIPGSLLEYNSPGSSLTYQNVEQEFIKFVKTCLGPDYLVVIEQHMSDLLARTLAAKFDVAGFQRADVKTRWEVYKLATEVLGQEEAAELARVGEGLVPGDVEFAPIPFSPPAAIPTRLPIQERSLQDLRCSGCGKLAGRISGAAEIKCNRCGQLVTAA